MASKTGHSSGLPGINVNQVFDSNEGGSVTGVVINYQSPPRDRNLDALIEKVENFWVEGVLKKSLYNEVLIELDMVGQSDAVDHPWSTEIEVPDSSPKPVPKGKSIEILYEEVGRTLLILGAPGSGKTITLLQLAEELIETARQDPISPVPVVFNLSSWAESEWSLFDWIIEEFKLKYKIPKRFSREWIENHWLVFLLDGLDEVRADKRAACVRAINEFSTEYGIAGLVVCSRMKEYTVLSTRLSLGGALYINPLGDKDIREYVARAQGRLSVLGKLLESDSNLHTLAKTPLMLSVMSLAYEGLDEKAIEKSSVENEQVHISHLFSRYVNRMFARKGNMSATYSKKDTIEGLSWLAGKMQEHGKTIFQIEELQPSWLTSKRGKIGYFMISRFCGGLIFGLSAGLIFGLLQGPSFGLVFGLSGGLSFGLSGGGGDSISIYFEDLWEWIRNRPIVLRFTIELLIYGLIGGLTGWLSERLLYDLSRGMSEGLIGGLTGGLIGGIFWSLRSLFQKQGDIQTVEQLGWSLKKSIRRAASGLIFGLIGGLIVGLSFMLSFKLIGGLIFGESIVLIYGLIGGLIFGLIYGLSFGGITTSIFTDKQNPNQGIGLSLWNALRVGLIFGLIFGLVGGLIFGLIEGLSEGLIGGLVFGLIGGLSGLSWFGGMDASQHYVLRGILYSGKRIPFRYSDFLDYAAKLILMRKVGGSYIFIHRTLLEYFAELREEQKDVQGAPITHKS